MSRFALLLLLWAVASTATGQALLPGETTPETPTPDSLRTDSLAPPPPRTPPAQQAWFLYGRSLTYADILAEARQLRRRPEPLRDSLESVDPVLGITGLVVDETVSPPGRLFYETFFLRWRPPQGAERMTVSIAEQPLPGNGTAIVIRADGEVLVQTRLPRRQEEVEDLAQQAVTFVQRRLSGG